MSKLKSAGIGAAGTGGLYLGLKAMANEGVGFAANTVGVVDSTAGVVAEILQNIGVQVGDLAPISQKFIDELSTILTGTSLVDAGIATGVGLVGNWVGKKTSQIAGKIIKVESEADDRVMGLGIGVSGALGILGASTAGLSIAAGTTGYVLGRKLGEKVLGEKYAKYTGMLGALGVTGLAWGMSPGIVLGGAAIAGGLGLVRKSGEGFREGRKAKKQAKNS